ncbi:MAG: transpeptidase-transglycosylase [Candidatus Rokuibacteriota bacterium]|nr:MAG: transpeptidase-transglycosylase [Candidatus Rokubacteria bacterium]
MAAMAESSERDRLGVLTRHHGRWRRWALGVALAVVMGAPFLYSAIELVRFERADARRATFIYASGQSLAPGVHVQHVALAATLARLGYTETRMVPPSPGHFRRTGGGWEIFVRGTEDVGSSSELVRLEVVDDRIARISRGGQEVADVTLEPEVLASASDRPGEDHRPVRLEDTPRVLIDAVLAAEDHRFFEHGGVDLRALVRAAWANLRAGKVKEGGSTITQQLVKVRLLSPQRTLVRKLREAWLAALVESRYSKERILEAYLNEIYLGQRGPIAIRGVGAATRAYFGKEVHQLTTGEAALLAAIIRGPNIYAPAVDPDRARDRRNTVLAQMRELGMIARDEYDRARRAPVRVRSLVSPGQSAPYFVDHVRQELEQRFGAEVSRVRGVRIVTTLDLNLQRFAEAAAARGVDRLETSLPRQYRRDPGRRLQVAVIVIEPGTGEIRALVGGRDYLASQFNRVTLARRQPGSAFKPVVYLAALRARDGVPPFTPASRVDDLPITLQAGGQPWSPRNYEDRYAGTVSVRQALEQSLNAATVRIAQTVGLPNVIETARMLGFHGQLAPVPAMALGAFEVTPLEMARAYLPLANGGVRLAAVSGVRSVRYSDEEVKPIGAEGPVRVISQAEAWLVTSLLKGVVTSGTGSAARESGLPDVIAGKTGTTNDGRDAWFVGYTSRLLALVWVGFDGGEPHGLSGARAALPIWVDFMKQAIDAYPQPDFTVPTGIVFTDIDVTNGKRAGRSCPVVVREAFLTGTEPPLCDEHRGVIDAVVGGWNRLTDWFRRPSREPEGGSPPGSPGAR